MAATADELTGLPSARAFAVALDRQAALARRYDRPGAVIVLECARADDPGCRAVARALRSRLRTTDLVSRLVGCEFAILLPEARAADARELAGELVTLLAGVAGVPATAGVACFPDGLDRPAGALLADADTALAAARGAQPPVALFDARVFRTARGLGSRAERLRRALEGDDLVLERAPVVDLRTGVTDHHALAARLRGAAGRTGCSTAPSASASAARSTASRCGTRWPRDRPAAARSSSPWPPARRSTAGSPTG